MSGADVPRCVVRYASVFIAFALCAMLSHPVRAQSARASFQSAAPQQADPIEQGSRSAPDSQRSNRSAFGEEGPVLTDWDAQLESFWHALIRLPVAAVLSAVLAFRPRRRGTPKRQAPVIQTQIILAIVGALVMMVVGVSLARAFGIVGAAGLIRYRAKIEDPKDAGVMLSTLGLGLASGVGLYVLAAFATAFLLVILSIIESIEPERRVRFDLTITAKDPTTVKKAIEGLLRRRRIPFELRSTAADEVSYEVQLPMDTKTDTISEALLGLDPSQTINVKWEQKKEPK